MIDFIFLFSFLPVMCFAMGVFLSFIMMNIGTININGARSATKRALLFKMCELKKLDVAFIQETHSD